MLSYILRLAFQYEESHEFRPNLLYISPDHLHQLRLEFDNSASLQTIVELLDMEVIITRDADHPHVGWVASARQLRAAS